MKCQAPNIGVFYRTNQNRIAPCCQYQQTWAPEDYEPSIPLAQIASSSDYIDNCSICREQSLHKTTLREKFENYADNWGDDGIVYADIRTSNYCNLQCNMCSPLDSSKIESFVKFNPDMEQYFKDVMPGYQNSTVNVPVADLGKLRVLKVAGGEPTIDPECIKFLDKFIAEHDPALVELWVTTNATRMLSFLRKYKPHFKRLCVTLSLDASGEILEFIRYPANWNQIKQNIDVAIAEELCDDMNINVVVQPYNLITVSSWAPWFSEFRKRVPRTKIVFNECSNPKHFSTRAMTDGARAVALESINFVEQEYPNLADKCDELKQIVTGKSYEEKYHKKLIEYTDTIGVKRNINPWKIDPAMVYLK